MADNEKHETTDISTQQGQPHEAVFHVLASLPVFELLSMSQVCRSLRDAVEHDILPWLNIIVEKPLNTRLSDDFLRKITYRANGQLRTLALMNCGKISDGGLQNIADKNPYIEKLFVPGCTSLTPSGVIKAVKMLPRLKALKINGIYNMKKDELQTLHHLIGEKKQGKNLYYNYRNNSSSFTPEETEPSIDVDVCPKCSEVRMVFDCPRKSCKSKQQQQRVMSCRGCYYCISRCEECGLCIKDDDELGDAACADTLCLSCWLQLPKCSFCNKAYCRQHADQKVDFPGSNAFLCVACHVEPII